MMKQLLQKLSVVLLVLVVSTAVHAEIAVTTSYYCNFEDSTENANWRLHPTTAHNILVSQWEIGTAVHAPGGNSAMYVSMDGGITAGSQQKASGFCISTYRVFAFEQGTYALNFDWCAGGEEELAVAIVEGDTMTNQQMRLTSSTFPPSIQQDIKVSGLSSSVTWQHKTTTFTVTQAGTFILVFAWRSNGQTLLNLGGAVDNIEIYKKQTDATACNYTIQNFRHTLADGVITLSWQGNADRYELVYFGSDDILHTTGDTITGDTIKLFLEDFTDGVYTFQLRGMCDDGTTPWAYVRNILVYDPANHCIDYLNFSANGVVCKYGSGEWGGSSETMGPGQIFYFDDGYASRYSTHTIHYVVGETDAMTNGQLRTVPEGGFASVRLGGKEPNNQSPGPHYEQISYTIPVDSTMGIVLFRYAYIGQTGGHGAGDLTQPHLRLKLYDQRGAIINGSECGNILFTAPDNDNDMAALNSNPRTAGWHKGAKDDGQGTICSEYVYWRDWTTVGINVQDYVGENIKIEVTNYGCGASCHYGYCYFVLDCADGKLGGVTCGEKPRAMTADDGFDYRWYKPYNMDEPFYEGQDPTAQSLYVAPNDSNTYYVDLMSKANQNCYFTLHASALGRFPKARVNFAHTPEDCINKVNLTNLSDVFGYYYTNDSTEMEVGGQGELTQAQFEIHTASGTTPLFVSDGTAFEPVIASNEGDTVYVKAYVAMDEGCYDEAEYKFAVPAIYETQATDTVILCQGDTLIYTYDGQDFVFWDSGDKQLSLLKNWAGCDSTFTLHIDYQYSYIFQRWDDILSVYFNDSTKIFDGERTENDSLAEQSMRYDFIGFQWLKNGDTIPGATKSYYKSPEPLSPNDDYRVVLLFSDGHQETSCEFTPTEYQTYKCTLAPTLVAANGKLYLNVEAAATVSFVQLTSGTQVKQEEVAAGKSVLTAPNDAGFYAVQVVTENFTKTFKIKVD